jgi:hypothetical protein
VSGPLPAACAAKRPPWACTRTAAPACNGTHAPNLISAVWYLQANLQVIPGQLRIHMQRLQIVSDAPPSQRAGLTCAQPALNFVLQEPSSSSSTSISSTCVTHDGRKYVTARAAAATCLLLYQLASCLQHIACTVLCCHLWTGRCTSYAISKSQHQLAIVQAAVNLPRPCSARLIWLCGRRHQTRSPQKAHC